jgi:hypothetical protein
MLAVKNWSTLGSFRYELPSSAASAKLQSAAVVQ